LTEILEQKKNTVYINNIPQMVFKNVEVESCWLAVEIALVHGQIGGWIGANTWLKGLLSTV
jgi:hypothetical protein